MACKGCKNCKCGKLEILRKVREPDMSELEDLYRDTNPEVETE